MKASEAKIISNKHNELNGELDAFFDDIKSKADAGLFFIKYNANPKNRDALKILATPSYDYIVFAYKDTYLSHDGCDLVIIYWGNQTDKNKILLNICNLSEFEITNMTQL